MPPLQLPLTVIGQIADCLEDPFPIHYLNLAQVSKEFFQVFTSDRAWSKFDVYGVKHGVYRHYLRLKATMSQFEWMYEFIDVETEIEDFKQEYRDLNRYSQLSVLRMRNREKEWLSYHVSCRDLMLKAVQLDGLAIEYADATLRNDVELVKLAAQQNGECLRVLPAKFATQREIALSAARSNGWSMEFLPAKFRSDREIVEAAVRSCPNCIKFVPDPLAKDEDILGLVFGSSYHCEPLRFVPLERVTKELAILAVSHHTPQMGQLAGKYGDDRDVVLAAVSREGWTLCYASDRLKADRKLVAIAAENNGAALGDAAPSLRNDRDFVYRLVKAYGSAYKYAPQKFQQERELALLAAATHGYALQAMPDKYRNDREIVRTSILRDPMSLRFASDQLRDCKELVQLAVDLRPRALLHSSDRLKADPELALSALARDGKLLDVLPQYADNRALKVHAIMAGAESRSLCGNDAELKVLRRWNVDLFGEEISGYEWWGMNHKEKLAAIFQRTTWKPSY